MHRGTMMFQMADIEEAIAGPGLSEPSFTVTGVPYQNTPFLDSAVVIPQGATQMLSLRRDVDSGRMDLVSALNSSGFRLSEFVAEYDFADWECPPEQADLVPGSLQLGALEGINLDNITSGRFCE